MFALKLNKYISISPNTTPRGTCIFLHIPPILIIKLLTYLCTLESHLGGKGSVFPSALTLA
jgi:hypothetical protein